MVQFGGEDVWVYGGEHLAVVHLHIALLVLQMVQCSVKDDGDGILHALKANWWESREGVDIL